MIDLIRRLNWGIDKNATLRLLSRFQKVEESPTQNAIGLSGEVFGNSSFVVCYFKKKVFGKDSLVRVNVLMPVERPSDQRSKELFTSLRSDLSQFLNRTPHDVGGTQNAPPEFRVSKMSVWRKDDTVITLTLSLVSDTLDISSPPIAIGIGYVKDDPISHQWDFLEP